MFTPVPTYPAQSVTSRLISVVCCSLALAHHCQTVSVLGSLIPHPWPVGEPADTAGFPLAHSPRSVVSKAVVPFTGTLRLKRCASKALPLQTMAERSTTAKLLQVLALHRKLPEIHVLALQQLQESSSHSTQGARAVLQGLPSCLQQIWDLCNSHHYFQALKMQDMALSGLA